MGRFAHGNNAPSEFDGRRQDAEAIQDLLELVGRVPRDADPPRLREPHRLHGPDLRFSNVSVWSRVF